MPKQEVNLQLSYADAELLQEAIADAIRHRSRNPEDFKTRFDYRYLATQIALQMRDHERAA